MSDLTGDATTPTVGVPAAAPANLRWSRIRLYAFAFVITVTTDSQDLPPPVSSASGERVLYVDDERALVDLSTRILGRPGYEVIGYTEPDRALQAFRAHPEHFAAAVTDLSMPGMSGFELSRALLEVRPDLAIVMTFGYVRPEDQESAAYRPPRIYAKAEHRA